MINVIIPVFSNNDLLSLPNCFRFLKQLKTVERVLVLHNPSIGIVESTITKEFDAKIAELTAEKKAAVTLDNFSAAQKLKEEIEGVEMDRSNAIRDGWKSIPESQRKPLYAKALAGLGTEPVCLREHYEAKELFTMMQSFMAQFPLDIPIDSYCLLWPQSVRKVEPVASVKDAWLSQPARTLPIIPATGVPITQAEVDQKLDGDPAPLSQPSVPTKTPPAEPVAHKIVVPEWKKLPKNSRGYREGQLRESRYMGIRSAAVKLGVFEDKMGLEAMLTRVLDKEFPASEAVAS